MVGGTNIEGAGYTIDQPIVLAFDRFLDPITVTRQSITLADASGSLFTDALIAYDPVTLRVTLSDPGPPNRWLTAGDQYRVVLNVPSTDGGSPYGLTAIDGATLGTPVTILFTAGAAANPPYTGVAPVDYCTLIQDKVLGRCTGSECHSPPVAQPGASLKDSIDQPPLGLVLSSPEYTRATAIGLIASESNTGALAAVQSSALGETFGIDMAVIAKGEPGNSFLLYKTLLAEPKDPANSPISKDERARLGNYILGNIMPYYDYPDGSTVALSELALENLSNWIAQGAPTPKTCP